MTTTDPATPDQTGPPDEIEHCMNLARHFCAHPPVGAVELHLYISARKSPKEVAGGILGGIVDHALDAVLDTGDGGGDNWNPGPLYSTLVWIGMPGPGQPPMAISEVFLPEPNLDRNALAAIMLAATEGSRSPVRVFAPTPVSHSQEAAVWRIAGRPPEAGAFWAQSAIIDNAEEFSVSFASQTERGKLGRVVHRSKTNTRGLLLRHNSSGLSISLTEGSKTREVEIPAAELLGIWDTVALTRTEPVALPPIRHRGDGLYHLLNTALFRVNQRLGLV